VTEDHEATGQAPDVWQHMPYGPDDVPWLDELPAAQAGYMPSAAYTEVETDAHVRQRARARKATMLRTVWSILWCIAAIGLIALTMTAGVSMFGYGALLGGLLFGLPRALRGTGVPSLVWAAVYYVFAVLSAALSMGMVADPGLRYATIGGIIVVCVLYGLGVDAWYRARQIGGAPPAPVSRDVGLIPAQEADATCVWGEAPGTGAQYLTGQLLDTLTQIPTVRVVHHVQLPGGGGEVMDHVLVCGNLVVPIDSEQWSGGHYAWHDGQILVTPPDGAGAQGAAAAEGSAAGPHAVAHPGATQAPHAPTTHPDPLPIASDGMRRLFLNEQVEPVIVIHSSDRAPVTTDNTEQGRHPRLMTAQDLIEQLGRECLDQDTRTVDRRVLTSVVQMRV
jgi:hypothetical protein